jgi:hypothetical protein
MKPADETIRTDQKKHSRVPSGPNSVSTTPPRAPATSRDVPNRRPVSVPPASDPPQDTRLRNGL